MSPLLSLEYLEDRSLPSGSNVGSTIIVRPEPGMTAGQYRPIPRELANSPPLAAWTPAAPHVVPGSAAEYHEEGMDPREQFLFAAAYEDVFRHRADVSENVPLLDREAAGLLSSIATSSGDERGFAFRSSGAPGSSVRETPVAVADRFPAESGTHGQPALYSTAALSEAPLTLDLTDSADGTAELALPGPFADGVILDAWQGGLPLPRTEPVPIAARDLTIIAAYLVGTPPTARSADGAAPSSTESSLTDFIVGHQDSWSAPSFSTAERPVDASAPDLALEQGLCFLDRAPTVLSRRHSGSATGAVTPPDDGRAAPAEQQDVDPNDGE